MAFGKKNISYSLNLPTVKKVASLLFRMQLFGNAVWDAALVIKEEVISKLAEASQWIDSFQR